MSDATNGQKNVHYGKILLAFEIMAATVVGSGLAIGGASAQSTTPGVFVLTHAKIYSVASAPVEDSTVIIRDGKIAAIGPVLEVPSGAKVIDATGLQIYPGLFDSITQMGLREIGAVSATVDTNETGNFNPDVVAATAILPSSEHITVTRAAGITEVLAVPASGGMDSFGGGATFGGQASAIHMAGWTIEDMAIKKSIAMVVNWPQIETETFDFSTFSRKEKPYSEAKTEYDKQVQEISDYLDRARHYAQAMDHSGNTTADFLRDVRLESLVPVVRGQLPMLVFADRAREIRAAVEYCYQYKLRVIIAGGMEAYKVKDLLRSKGIPVILRPTQSEPVDEDDAYDREMTQPAELAAAGVKFAFASFDNSFSRRLGQSAATAAAHGLSRDEALKAVTLYPAQIFGLSDQLGTIEVGKTANIIVTTGDPLEVTTDVRYLFIKGQLTSTDNKQKTLYEKYKNRPKAK